MFHGRGFNKFKVFEYGLLFFRRDLGIVGKVWGLGSIGSNSFIWLVLKSTVA